MYNFDDAERQETKWAFKVLGLIIVVGVFIFLVSGCASESELKILSDNSVRVAQMQAKAVAVRRDTLTVDCSQGGCGNAKITYIDPRDRQQVTGVKVKGTNDVIVGVAPQVVSIVGWVAGAVAAARIVDDVMAASGGNNTTTHNTTAVIGDNNTTTASTSVTKSETQSNGNVAEANDNQANPVTSTSTNTTTTDNSNQNNPVSTDDNTNNSVTNP